MNTYKTADLSGAEWISTGGACCTPMIRKTLSFPKVTSAKITIAGLGIFEIFFMKDRRSFTAEFPTMRRCATACIARFMTLLLI